MPLLSEEAYKALPVEEVRMHVHGNYRESYVIHLRDLGYTVTDQASAYRAYKDNWLMKNSPLGKALK